MMRRMLAAAAAVVLLAGCDGSGGEADPSPSAGDGSSDVSSDATTDPTTGAPISQDEAVACPDGVVELDPELPDEVPEGATSVRLCAGGDDEVTPPTDALVTEVAAVVARVNDQPVVTRGCADRRLPTYQLAFGYPDGSTFVVAGRFTGCAELLVGSGRRAKAGPPLRTFVDSLVAQRASAVPPDRAIDPADLDCAREQEDRTFPLGEPTGLTVAVLCLGNPEQPARARRVMISPDQLATLVESMRTHTTAEDEMFGCSIFLSAPTDHWIVGANAWGDPVTMKRVCLGLSYGPDREWRPRQQAKAIIQRLIDRAR